jgi:hypothetical protein
VLESIIDPFQTAYVPGRLVADNLRSNFFYKNHCNKNNIDAVLISLDAKKAFDSVDHKYIKETLIAYGFGPGFIQIFKTSTETSQLGSSLMDLPVNQSKLREELSRATP